MSVAATSLLVALAAYGLAALAASAFTAGAWRLLRARPADVEGLTLLRLLPAGIALLVAASVGAAFLAHEPVHPGERHPAGVYVLAGAAVVMLAAGATRMARAWLATRRHVARWRAAAEPLDGRRGLPCFRVEDTTPQACVAGLRRPRLYVTSALLSALSSEELDLVLRHEEAHVRGRHNLGRWVLTGAPDALAGTAAAREIERAWSAAAERDADGAATAGDPDKALRLAGALVRVGRAGIAPAPVLAAAAVTSGDALAERVRHLIDAPPGRRTRLAPAVVGAVLVAAAVLAGLTDLAALHEAVEPLVSR